MLPLVILAGACRSADAHRVLAEDLGPAEALVAAFASLIDEIGPAERPCVAIADTLHSRPAAPADAIVLETLRARGHDIRPYTPRCDGDGTHTVAIAWIEHDDRGATVGAARWYGQTMRGALLCEMRLTNTNGAWAVDRPCREGIRSVVN